MRAELKLAYQFCRNLARAKAGNFYYAFIFLPRPKRQAIYALYAFCQYGDQMVDEIPPEGDPVSDIDDLRADLKNCLDDLYSTPLFRALADSIRRYNLPMKHFDDLITGMETDLHRNRFETFAELEKYCYSVASTVGLLCVEIFGYKDESVREYARNLGIALQLTNIVRDVKEDAGRNRIYIPREDLERFGYSEEKLLKSAADDNFKKLMMFQYERAVEYYRKADESLQPAERKNEIASEIMKIIYRELLEEIKTNGFKVFDKRFSIKGLRKVSLAMSTYLQILLGRNSR